MNRNDWNESFHDEIGEDRFGRKNSCDETRRIGRSNVMIGDLLILVCCQKQKKCVERETKGISDWMNVEIAKSGAALELVDFAISLGQQFEHLSF